MRAHLDDRFAHSAGGLVRIELPLRDFRELVEWIEEIRPNDLASAELRGLLNELDPAEAEQPTLEKS